MRTNWSKLKAHVIPDKVKSGGTVEAQGRASSAAKAATTQDRCRRRLGAGRLRRWRCLEWGFTLRRRLARSSAGESSLGWSGRPTAAGSVAIRAIMLLAVVTVSGRGTRRRSRRAPRRSGWAGYRAAFRL